MNTLTWNGEAVTGPIAILAAPVMGIFIALIFTLLLSPVVWLGQLLFSFISDIKVSYKSEQSQSD